MSIQKKISQIWHTITLKIRLQLACPDALIPLAVMGLISGLLAGGIIVLFRFTVESFQDQILPGTGAENYEELSIYWRFLFPVIGGLLLGGIFHYWSQGLHTLGIARVMERLAYHQGYLTLRGFILQFIGAAIAIISGHSIGREGPHIYLGATITSLVGQAFTLPNNAIRIMVGCGAAAGIAASFNTPLAGVVFALEVLMLEYTVASFMPIILATVSATAISNAILGTDPAFQIHHLHMNTLEELPIVLILGLLAGTTAASFVHLLQKFSHHGKRLPIWWRTTLAGIIVGLCGIAVPQVLGIGYDTISNALLGQLGLDLLIVLILVKLLATSASVGLGIPGGIIGPAFFIGASLGNLVAIIANQILPNGIESEIGYYALLGMGAMMAAALNAPLAALIAMMELTYNPGIIMSGMLVVVVANLTSSQIFHKESLFIATLKSSGMDYKTSPLIQSLRRVGIASIMNENIQSITNHPSPELIQEIIHQPPEWLIIKTQDQTSWLMSYANFCAATEHHSESYSLNLLAADCHIEPIIPIRLEANLQEALEQLNQSPAEALFVQHKRRRGQLKIYGIVTRDMLKHSHQ